MSNGDTSEPYLEGIIERLDRLIELGESAVDRLDAIDSRAALAADFAETIANEAETIRGYATDIEHFTRFPPES